MSAQKEAKYYHKIDGKWKALTREESNKALGIKEHETRKEN